MIVVLERDLSHRLRRWYTGEVYRLIHKSECDRACRGAVEVSYEVELGTVDVQIIDISPQSVGVPCDVVRREQEHVTSGNGGEAISQGELSRAPTVDGAIWGDVEVFEYSAVPGPEINDDHQSMSN